VVQRLLGLARRWSAVFLVLAIGTTATAAVTSGVAQAIDAQDRQRFEGAADRVRDGIRDLLEMYVAMLRAAAGLFAASDFVTEQEFRAFVDRLELRQRYPGVQGIGYTARIPSEQLGDTIAEQRRRGRADFTVWPDDPRAEYHSILYLEPLDARNQAAIGYDMYTDETRRAAMARARDSGAPAASGLVTLVQEIAEEKQPGFLIYIPVYHGATTPGDLDERRTQLRGFVHGPFRAIDLFASIPGDSPLQRAGFELFDGDGSEQALVHRSGVPGDRPFEVTRTLDVAGRTWTIRLFATPELDITSSRGLVSLIGWGGAAITLLLTGLVWLQTRARQRAEKSEAAAADASTRFQQLANSIPQLAWMANPDGWIYWYNDRWYEYTGTSPQDMAGWGWQSVHDPQTLPKVLERWRESIEAGRAFEMEFPLRGADGRFQWFLTRVVPFRDATGAVVQWFGTNTNVQYRHDAERALLEQAETLNIINRTGAQLAGELDLDRLVRSVVDAGTLLTRAQVGAFVYSTVSADGGSHTQYALSGVSPESLRDWPMSRIRTVFASSEGIIRSADVTSGSLVATGMPFDRIPAGHPAVRSYMAVPVRLRSGEVVGGLFFGHAENGVFTPQTERIITGIAAQAAIAIDNARLYGRVQELLDSERGARLEIERQSRMKDEFLATLSHELRTPLNAVMGWAHMLSAGAVPADKRQHAIDTILRNAQSQSRLIEDLLDMSRIISGRMSLQLGVVDLREVCEAAVNVVRPLVAAKKLAVTVSAESGATYDVRGDAGRLQQVLLNLLTNAIKFTPSGGRIDVALRQTPRAVEVAVRDTGMGIAPEFLPHVFDRFRQADGSFTRGHGGLGLGLAIVRSLIDMHDGAITVASDGPGHGATFTISVPAAARASVGPDHPTAAAAESLGHPAWLQNLSVLVVEDDDDARDLAREVLSQYGAHVVLAHSGIDALAVLDSNARFNLIVSDIGMPVMDGYEFIREVRARTEAGPRVRAIAITAYAGAADQRRALNAGFDLHLAKPFTPDQLVAACAALMVADAPGN